MVVNWCRDGGGGGGGEWYGEWVAGSLEVCVLSGHTQVCVTTSA